MSRSFRKCSSARSIGDDDHFRLGQKTEVALGIGETSGVAVGDHQVGSGRAQRLHLDRVGPDPRALFRRRHRLEVAGDPVGAQRAGLDEVRSVDLFPLLVEDAVEGCVLVGLLRGRGARAGFTFNPLASTTRPEPTSAPVLGTLASSPVAALGINSSVTRPSSGI